MTEQAPPQNTITSLVVVRHGETEWNRAGRWQGQLDSPLTPLGQRQAMAMAEECARRGIEALVASDLGRARQTADTVSERTGLATMTDDGFRERNFGEYQGLTRAEIDARRSEKSLPDMILHPALSPPGGESMVDFQARCVAAINRVADHFPGKLIGVVSHGGVLRALLHHALNMSLSEPRHFSLFNCSMNVFSRKGEEWRLDTWGETAHLHELTTLDDE